MAESSTVSAPGEPLPNPHERRGASLHIRAGSRFEFAAHIDVAPLRLLAIGALVAGILWSVPPIIRAARMRR